MMRNNTAYDLDIFENRVPRPRPVPGQPKTAPEPVKQTAKQKKQQVAALARHRFLARAKVGVVAASFFLLIGAFLFGKVQLAEDMIVIGQLRKNLEHLKSEQTRLASELEQQVSIRVVEEFVTKQLGMVRINQQEQKKYINTDQGEQVTLITDDARIGPVDKIKEMFDPQPGVVNIGGQ